jgi:hypothetical protein
MYAKCLVHGDGVDRNGRKWRDISDLHVIKAVLQRGWTMQWLYEQGFLVDLILTKLDIYLDKLSHRIDLRAFCETLSHY